MYEVAIKQLITLWLRAYHRARITTVVLTIIIVAGFSIGIYFTEKNQQVEQEAKRLQNQNYAKQIESLDQIKNNLNDLIRFVDSQREQLKQSETTLASLKTEHDKFKPLLEADRRIIDALFAAQESRNKEAQNRERWIGFGLGILASLFASFVYALVTALLKRRREAEHVQQDNPIDAK